MDEGIAIIFTRKRGGAEIWFLPRLRGRGTAKRWRGRQSRTGPPPAFGGTPPVNGGRLIPPRLRTSASPRESLIYADGWR